MYLQSKHLSGLWAKDIEKRDRGHCPQGVPILSHCWRKWWSVACTEGPLASVEQEEVRDGFLSIDTRPMQGSHQSSVSLPHPPHPPASLLTLLTDFADTSFKMQKQTSALWVWVIAYSKLAEFELMRFKRVIFLLIVKWVCAVPMRPLE